MVQRQDFMVQRRYRRRFIVSMQRQDENLINDKVRNVMQKADVPHIPNTSSQSTNQFSDIMLFFVENIEKLSFVHFKGGS